MSTEPCMALLYARLWLPAACTRSDRSGTATPPNEAQRAPGAGWVCENDLKHVYTQYTQGATSNGSLSRDMAAEPALEACHRGTCQGRHERPARARASARTARHAGWRRPHLAGHHGHLPRVETGPEAACAHAQGADEQRESREHMEKEGRNRSQIADRAASSKVEAAARGAK